MAKKIRAVDPGRFPDEAFDLYSIPAHDHEGFETRLGSQIGSSKMPVEPGDVVVSKIAPHLRRSRVIDDFSGRTQLASGEWIIFRSDRFHPQYLKHFLVSDRFHAQFMTTVAGVGGSLLRARPSEVARICVPLPPLAEQRRIASILDQTDALRAKRRQVLTHLDALSQSIFHDMFGAADFARGELNDLAEVTSGITKGRRVEGETEPVPYLAVANVQAGRLELNPIKTIEATAQEIERYRLQSGDVVMTEGGDPDKLGRGTVWREELPLCLHQNHIFRVRCTPDGIRPEYLVSFLASRDAKDYFRRCAKQTTGIASINMRQLRALPVPVPPVAAQDEFIARLIHSFAVRERAARAAGDIDALFVALQSRAFSGNA